MNNHIGLSKLLFLLLIFISLLEAKVGVLKKVVDGDTLHFNTNNKKVKSRIEYIDTPESSNNSKNKKDVSKCNNVSEQDMKSAGKSATRYDKRLLKLNTEYEYETKGKDRYGRYICVVKNGDTTFNEQMVTGGYASIFRFYMNKEELTYYEDLLLIMEIFG
jgi:endonuclease YncB( thermonuclease family)